MNIPKHIVIFPDGNRRWAKEKGLPTLEGHKIGYQKLVDFTEWCIKRGVKTITAYGFSTENWNRTKEEVDYLMDLLEKGILANLDRNNENGVRVRIIGQKERLPEGLQNAIKKAEETTKNNTNLNLNLAISYGGRWDIMNATKQIIKEGIDPEKIDEKLFESYLSTAGLENPDFIIRAGGEMRMSNFVLWQGAYSELYFCPKYWPAFEEKDLDEALEEFDKRQRRFGK